MQFCAPGRPKARLCVQTAILVAPGHQRSKMSTNASLGARTLRSVNSHSDCESGRAWPERGNELRMQFWVRVWKGAHLEWWAFGMFETFSRTVRVKQHAILDDFVGTVRILNGALLGSLVERCASGMMRFLDVSNLPSDVSRRKVRFWVRFGNGAHPKWCAYGMVRFWVRFWDGTHLEWFASRRSRMFC